MRQGSFPRGAIIQSQIYGSRKATWLSFQTTVIGASIGLSATRAHAEARGAKKIDWMGLRVSRRCSLVLICKLQTLDLGVKTNQYQSRDSQGYEMGKGRNHVYQDCLSSHSSRPNEQGCGRLREFNIQQLHHDFAPKVHHNLRNDFSMSSEGIKIGNIKQSFCKHASLLSSSLFELYDLLSTLVIDCIFLYSFAYMIKKDIVPTISTLSLIRTYIPSVILTMSHVRHLHDLTITQLQMPMYSV